MLGDNDRQLRIAKRLGWGTLFASLSSIAFTAASAQTAVPPAAAPAIPTADAQPAPSSDSSAAAPEAASDQNTPDSENIVVYGRRRSETVYQTPLAVTALNPQALAQQSISQITDLTRVAPNVIIRQSSSGGGDVQLMIRGQIIATSNSSIDPPVGVYVDDAYIAHGRGLIGSVFDLSSVEISRGVQGTLSGRNNTGGAVRFYTQRPILGELSGIASGSLGTHSLHRESGVLNVPVGDALALRFGVQDSYRGPLGHSTITGEPFQSINQQLYRAGLLWQPAEDLTAYIVYDYSHIRERSAAYHTPLGGRIASAVISCTRGATNVSGACYPADVVSPPNIHDVSTSDPAGFDHVRTHFVRGVFDYHATPFLDAKVNVAYRSLYAFQDHFDVDYSPALQTLSDGFGETSRQFTLEPQLTLHLFDNHLTLVGGYFYFHDNARQEVAGGVRSGILSGNTYAFSISHVDDHLVNQSNAGYLHGELALTPRWTVAAGVRYTKDDRLIRPNSYSDNSDPRSVNYARFLAGQVPAQICQVTRVVNGVSGPVNASGPCLGQTASVSFGYWSWEATTRYEITDGLAFYARTGLGEKSGGLTSPLRDLSQAPYRPERVQDYEVGLKGNGLFNNVLSFNLALYYSDYKDLQRFTSSVQPSGIVASQVFNVGSASIKGVEFDFNLRPTPALTFSGYLGYTDANYRKFTITNAAGTVFDLSGNRFFATPRWTGRLAANYRFDLPHGHLTVGGGWNYQSSASYYLFTFPQFIQSGYSLFDARIAYAPSDRLEIALWGTNLTDKQYFQAATVSPVNGFDQTQGFNSGAQIPGDSREIAATVTVRF